MSELNFDSIIASGVLQMPLYDTYNQRIKTTYDVKTKQEIQDIINIELKLYILQVNSIDDFKSQVINKIPDFNIKDTQKFKQDINKAIETKRIIPYFVDKTTEFSNRIELLTNDYNEYLFEKYDNITFQLKQYISNINKKSNQFVKLNKQAIFDALDEIIEIEKNKIKENKKIANKKYYENRRNQLGIEKKQPLTEEEKKERQKLAKEKFNEKKRQELGLEKKPLLTEEEKEENKRIAKQKYYQKKKQELGLDFDKEETEDQLKRKKYNETYYNKQKEMRNKVKELEAKLAELTK